VQKIPEPGSLVWLRQRRWRVERARVDHNTIRLDVACAAARLTVLTPFDRPVPLTRSRRMVRVRRQHARARLGGLVAMSPPARLVASAIGAQMRLWPFQFEPVLAVLDGQLAKGPYLLGERFSVADPYILMLACWLPDTPALLARLPNVARLCAATMKRPSIVDALARYDMAKDLTSLT